jgi:hypothetical protein
MALAADVRILNMDPLYICQREGIPTGSANRSIPLGRNACLISCNIQQLMIGKVVSLLSRFGTPRAGRDGIGL